MCSSELHALHGLPHALDCELMHGRLRCRWRPMLRHAGLTSRTCGELIFWYIILSKSIF